MSCRALSSRDRSSSISRPCLSAFRNTKTRNALSTAWRHNLRTVSVTESDAPGTKRHLIVDRQGIPLAALLTGANRHDSMVFEALVEALPAIRCPSGHRRKRPIKLHADKAYDIPRCRRFLHRRHIKVRIARKGVEASQRLGRHHWVVERTLAWLARYRRLTIRYERRLDIHRAFLTLGCALICFNHLPPTRG